MKKSLSILFGMIAFASAVLPASAIQYTLNQGNTGAVGNFPAPYATVDVILNDATHATITFTGLMTGGFTYLMGAAQALDVNVNASDFTVGSIMGMTSPSVDTSGQNVSMFGVFNLSIDNFDGASDANSPMSFQVTNVGGTWSGDSAVLESNDKVFLASAHIFVLDASGEVVQTGFAGNGTPSAPDGGMTALLLGTAFASMGLLRQKLLR